MTQTERKKWERFFKNDTFAGYVGIELEEIAPGRAKVKCEIKEHHLNGLRCVHGGMLFTIADMAAAAAANSHGKIAVGLNTSMSFVKAAKGPVVYAEAQEVSRSGRHAVYSVTVTDDSGDTVAAFQGLTYVKNEAWGAQLE
jgi:acyl-CoA thioesterase